MNKYVSIALTGALALSACGDTQSRFREIPEKAVAAIQDCFDRNLRAEIYLSVSNMGDGWAPVAEVHCFEDSRTIRPD